MKKSFITNFCRHLVWHQRLFSVVTCLCFYSIHLIGLPHWVSRFPKSTALLLILRARLASAWDEIWLFLCWWLCYCQNIISGCLKINRLLVSCPEKSNSSFLQQVRMNINPTGNAKLAVSSLKWASFIPLDPHRICWSCFWFWNRKAHFDQFLNHQQCVW